MAALASLYRLAIRAAAWLVIKTALLLIRAYQLTLSYWLGRQCRFTPSCSHYMAGAIQTHGLIAGGRLGLNRICRCGPNSAGGYDPVPLKANDA